MITKKPSARDFLFIFVLFSLILGSVLVWNVIPVLAVWSEPVTPPPIDELREPLNTGSFDQIKSGGLQIKNLKTGVITSTGICLGATSPVCISDWSKIGGSFWASSTGNNIYNSSGGGIRIGVVNPNSGTDAKLYVDVSKNTNLEGVRIISSNFSPFVIRNTSDTLDLFRVYQNGDAVFANNLTAKSIGGYATISASPGVGGYTAIPNTIGVLGFSSASSSWSGYFFGGKGLYTSNLCLGSETSCLNSWPASLPAGTNGQTLRSSGTAWVANSNLFNNGTNVGIGGVTAPSQLLSFPTSTLGNRITLYNGQMWGMGIQNSLLQFIVNSTGGNFAFGSGSSASFSEVMRIKGTGNVGIGTTTPSARLDIKGGGGTTVDLLVNGRIRSNNNDGGMWVASDRFVGGVNTNQIGFYNSGWDLIVNNSHNVGIGTTAPGAKLDVNGSVRVSGNTSNLYVNAIYGRADNAEDIWLGDANDTIKVLGKVSSTYLCLSGVCKSAWPATSTGTSLPTSTNGYTLRGNGTTWVSDGNLYNNGTNVGIGTQAPGAKLQVEGGSLLVNTGSSASSHRDIMMGGIGGWANGESHGIDTVYGLASSPTTFTRIESSFNGTMASMSFKNFYNSGPKTDTIMTIQGNGNVGIGTVAPGFPLNFASTIGDKISLYGNSGAHYGFGIQGNLMQIFTDSISSDIGFGYGSSGSMTRNVTFKGNGNVGIGTTAPLATLGVSEMDAGMAGFIFVSGAGDEFQYSGINLWDNNVSWATGTAGYLWGIHHRTGGGTDVAHSFQINGKDKNNNWVNGLTILPGTGNVGIGITNPVVKLDVNGLIKMRSGTITKPEDVINKAYLDSVIAGTSSIPTIGYWTKSGNNIYSSNTGNVGIGTTAPAVKLDIKGGSVRIGNSGFSGGQSGDLTVSREANSATGAIFFGNTSSKYLWFDGTNYQFGSAQLFVNTTNGRVGIASSSPMGLVGIGSGNSGWTIGNTDVASGAWLRNDGGNTVLSTNIGSLYLGYSGNTSKIIHIGNGNPGVVQITGSAPAGALVVNASGNVGIGTATPGAKLEVAGQVKITGGSPGAKKVLTSDATGLASWSTASSIESDPKVGSLGLNFVPKWQASTNSLINSSIYEAGGLVGIGTKMPVATLDVNGTSRFGANMIVSGNVTVNSGNFILGTDAKADLGYQMQVNTCTDYECTASCQVGYRVTGGGCNTSGGHKLEEDYPGTNGDGEANNSWHCHQSDEGILNPPKSLKAFAICMKVQ